jgi:hypothetical protein
MSTTALAVCGAPQPRLVCAEYFSSEVVVGAKLVRSEHIVPTNDIDGHVYEMRTEKVVGGKIGNSFQVWEENSSGRAGFEWVVGGSYLLFLYSKEDRGWLLDGCGNSGPLEKKQSVLQEIEALQNRNGGMIQVAIGGDWLAWSPPMSGVEVKAQGTHGTFSATTNDKGVAEIHVPAGQYALTVPNQQVQSYDFTYDYPENITIDNGGCAQIQFVTSDQRH